MFIIGEEQQWSVFNNQSKIIVGGNGKKPFFRGSISGIVSEKHFNLLHLIKFYCVIRFLNLICQFNLFTLQTIGVVI